MTASVKTAPKPGAIRSATMSTSRAIPGAGRHQPPGQPQSATPQCPCGGYVRKVRDAVYEDTYYSCVNCAREFPLNYTTPAETEQPEQLPEIPADPILLDANPLEPQAAITRLRWPQGLRCPGCRAASIRVISQPPQCGFVCDRCDTYFDHSTKTLQQTHSVPDPAWLEILQRSEQILAAPRESELRRITGFEPAPLRALSRDILRIMDQLEKPAKPLAVIAALTATSPQIPNDAASMITQVLAPESSALNFIRHTELHPVLALASLRWPAGIPCACGNNADFEVPTLLSSGAFTCRYCDAQVHLRDESILHRTNHSIATCYAALSILLTTAETPTINALMDLSGIAQHPATAIHDRFTRVIQEAGIVPGPNITVAQASSIINTKPPSMRGRRQPPERRKTKPAGDEPQDDDFPVMPNQRAKHPATAELAALRWPNGLICPHCGSQRCANRDTAKAPQPFQCRDCQRYFSSRTGSFLSGNSIPSKVWVPLIRRVTTDPTPLDEQSVQDCTGCHPRQAERILSIIKDALRHWPHEPGPDVTPEQIADFFAAPSTQAKKSPGTSTASTTTDTKTNEPPAENASTSEQPAGDEQAANRDQPESENQPASDDQPAGGDQPESEDQPAGDEQPAGGDQPESDETTPGEKAASQEAHASPGDASPDEHTPVEENASPDEDPTTEEEPSPSEDPSVDEDASPDEDPTSDEDASADEDTPVEEETSHDEDPTVDENPSPDGEPTGNEEPTTDDEPADHEGASPDEKPSGDDTPASEPDEPQEAEPTTVAEPPPPHRVPAPVDHAPSQEPSSRQPGQELAQQAPERASVATTPNSPTVEERLALIETALLQLLQQSNRNAAAEHINGFVHNHRFPAAPMPPYLIPPRRDTYRCGPHHATG